MLVSSIFTFFHSVFKRRLFLGHGKLGLCGKGLKRNNYKIQSLKVVDKFLLIYNKKGYYIEITILMLLFISCRKRHLDLTPYSVLCDVNFFSNKSNRKVTTIMRLFNILIYNTEFYWMSTPQNQSISWTTCHNSANSVPSSNLVCINPFPPDKILDQTKLKEIVDDKLNVTNMIISVFNGVENIVGKEEIACTSNFSFSHNDFKRLLS